jgi:hypothetical protein
MTKMSLHFYEHIWKYFIVYASENEATFLKHLVHTKHHNMLVKQMATELQVIELAKFLKG